MEEFSQGTLKDIVNSKGLAQIIFRDTEGGRDHDKKKRRMVCSEVTQADKKKILP